MVEKGLLVGRRPQGNGFVPDLGDLQFPGLQLAFEVGKFPRETGRSEGSHDAVEFGDDDVVPGDLAQVVGHGPVVGHAALKDDVPLVAQEEFTHAGHDGPGLRPAGAADDVPQGKAVLELVDAGGRKHRAHRGKFQIAVVVDPVGHLFDGHVQLRRHAVEKGSRAGGADTAHLVVPHVHVFVEHHGLAVLSPHVEDGLAVGVVVTRARHVGGDFADLEVVGDEVRGILHDLAAGDHRAGDVLQIGNARILKKFIHRLPQLAEVAGSAF